MPASVTDKDKGFFSIVTGLAGLHGAELKVGILGLDSVFTPGQEGAATLVDIGTFNEFGTSPKGQGPSFVGGSPARPFLRSTFDENLDKYELFIINLAKRKKVDPDKLLNLLGLRIQADVRRKITTLKSPANAPSTIKSKGSSNPLIDDGHMKQAINFEVTR